MGLQNGSLDASKLIQNTEVLEKKLEPVVDKLGEVIDKIDQLDGKKAKASVEIDTRDSSKNINEVKHEFEELLKTIKAPNQKKNYFQSIENSAKDLKKAWRDLVNEAGKGTFTEAEKYDNQYATTVLRCANAFEALKGNISEVSPEILEFVQGMRQIEKYSDARGYNFTVKGFEQAFEVFAKMKEVGATYNGFDFSKGFTEVKQDILELSSLTSIWGQSSSSASEQASEAYEGQGKAAEETVKKIEKLTEAEMERKLKSEHSKGSVYEWDIDLDDELEDIQKYSKALDELRENQRSALDMATYYQNRLVDNPDDENSSRWMNDYIENYHKYTDQIEFVQKRLQESIRDYTPNAGGETGQELNALIIILKDLHEEIVKISSAFANVDESSGIGSLIKSINEMSVALSEAIIKVGDLGEAFAGKDFSININAGNNSNPIDRQRKIGRSSRETIDALRKSFDSLSDELLGGTTTTLFQGLGKQFKDFYEVSARMNPDSDSLDATIYNYQKLIAILKEAANIKGIDISEWSNSFEKASIEAVEATNKIIDGEEETEKAANKLFDLFGNANKVDLSGMTVQLDGVVQELRAIAELVEKGFTVNDIINGKTTDTGEEVKGLEAVKQSVEDIKKAVDEKTAAFEKEGARVAQIVPMETGYLGKLISALKTINEQLEKISSFTGLDLSNVKVPTNERGTLSSTGNVGKKTNTNNTVDKVTDIIASKHESSIIRQQKEVKKLEETQAKAVNANIEREQKEIALIDQKVAKTVQARQEEEKRQELAQNKVINKALEQEYHDKQKLAEQIANVREKSELRADENSKKGELAQAKAINKALDESYKEQQRQEQQLQKQRDDFNKKNLNAIDYEIKKREEEGRLFSKQIKAQMQLKVTQEKGDIKTSKLDSASANLATRMNNNAAKAYDNLFKKAKKYYSLKQKEASGSLLDEEIKLLDDLKKEWDDAYQAKGRYAGNSKGDAESSTKLDEARHNFIDNNLSSYQISIKKFASDVQSTLDKIKLNKKNFQYGDDYYQLIDSLQTKITALNDMNLDIVTPKELQEVTELQNIINSLLTSIKNQTKNLDFQLADPEKAYQQMAKIEQILTNNTAMPRALKESFKALSREYQLVIDTKGSQNRLEELNVELGKLNYQLQASGKTGNSIFTLLGKKIKSISTNFVAMYLSFYDLARYLRQGFETIKEYDTALTEMNKVSEESISTLKEFQEESFGLADSIGTTAQQLQNSTADWMRLGESLEEAKQSAQDANILFNVSEFETIDEATDSLVSMSQAFKDLEKGEIIDVVNNLGNNFAISTDGLATALKDSASSLQTAQNDFFESAALVTAANTVVQDPAKVGAGLRTIALRLTGTEAAREELAALGEDVDDFVVTTTSKLDQQIKDLTKTQGNFGVSLLDMNGNYRSTYEVLLDIAKVWDQIAQEDLVTGENRQNALLEMMAGKNRSNILASVLQSPEILEEAYSYALDSEGSAMRENEAYLESIEAHLSQLKNAWDALWINENNREVITFFLDLAKAVLENVNEFGVLKTVLLGGGGIFAAMKTFKGEGK